MYYPGQEIAVWLRNLIKKAYVSRETFDDSQDYLNMQTTTLGKVTQANVVFPYGINAIPPQNTLGLCFNVLGSEDMAYFIPFAMVERFKNLKAGEVKVGSPNHQNFVYFKADDFDDFREKISNLILDTNLRQSLIENSKNNIEKYSVNERIKLLINFCVRSSTG